MALRFVSKAKATLHSPSAALNRNSLHIRVAGAAQSIDAWPPQLWPELLKEPCQRQNLRPHIFVQFVELRLKLIANLYAPAYSDNMPYSPYDVKSISPEPAP